MTGPVGVHAGNGRSLRLTALRCQAQLLSGTAATDPVDVAGRLLAVQAQDPRGFRLAVRSRTSGVTVDDLERALSIDRSLVVTTLNRGTLHLVRAEDYWWLHALTTPRLSTSSRRRLTETGLAPPQVEVGVKVVIGALSREGPLTRHELRGRLDAAGVPTVGQALIHLLSVTALRGFTVRGPMRDGEQAWVLVADWLGSPPALDRAAALEALARRYLAGHGPATERDLARWAGLPLRDARAGLAAIAGELNDLGGGLVTVTGAPVEAELAPPRLLGAFEPLLLGWCDREPIIGEDHTLVTSNGIFRPFALVGGRAVASWGLSSGVLTLRPFGPLSPATKLAVHAEAAAVGTYLGIGTPKLVVTAVVGPAGR
ncbi:MAG: winged helix DNA-binding domain-containing protein [Actinomycetota bacterium]|nr:winged helix DNA-binding domain-containing protein [Actinomycetota bacterium]